MDLNSVRTSPSCWSSYSRYVVGYCHCFLLSVVLDADTWKLFSGIRIILTCGNNLRDLTIKDCLDTKRFGITQSGRPPLRKDVLLQRRKAMRDGELLGGVGLTTNDLPICTVLFEIVDLGGVSEEPRVALVLRHQMPVWPQWSLDRYRVVYDRKFPCSDASHSVTTFLESNHSVNYQAALDYAHDRPIFSPRTYRVPAHSIRILPIHHYRPPFPGLPLEILRQIISEAILTPGNDDDWRSDLLSYGMVCKSWAHVLNLFYAFYSVKPNPPTAVSVAKWLQRKPENAKLIRKFNPRHFLDFADIGSSDVEYTRYCQALLDILELSTQIRQIEIIAIEESLLQRQIRALHQLREIRTCQITGDDPNFYDLEGSKRRCVTIDDVQSFIVRWPNLSDLDIDDCNARKPEDKKAEDFFVSAEGNASQTLQKLENLSLCQCSLIGNQLLKFAPHSQPGLKSLFLSHLQGIINSDLLTFLLAVSPSLTSLDINGCKIERHNPDEEYAIDAAMSRMVNLQHLWLSGACGTVLSIARRAPRRYPPSLVGNIRSPYIEIRLGPGMDCQGLSKALQVTSWASVTVRGDAITAADNSLRQEWRGIALARGIILIIG